MTDVAEILGAARSVLIVDWPSKDVPETLTRAGYAVAVKGGPATDDYAGYALRDGVYRPVEELPGLVALALELGATTVWFQSGVAPDGTRDPTGCSGGLG